MPQKFTYFTQLLAVRLCALFGFVLGFLGFRFLGSERTTAIIILPFFLLLVIFIVIYRIRVSQQKKNDFIFILIIVLLLCSMSTVLRSSLAYLLPGMACACILQVSSGSGEAAGPPGLESSSSSESLATFRAVIAADSEAHIYSRIRKLENNLYYLIPPQTYAGEYEGIVREHFDQALSVDDYRRIYEMEHFELAMLERKGLLQDRLHGLMLGEPNLARILDLSPYPGISREVVYDFLEGKVPSMDQMEHAFQRHIMDGTLSSFILDINQNGRNSQIYREFYSHFTDEDFRRKLGLPLP